MWSVSWGGWLVNGLSSIWVSLVSLPWRKKREKTQTQVIHHRNEIQWRIQGGREARALPPPPLFLDHTEARKAEKNSFGDRAAPFLRVLMTGAPLISRSRSGTDFLHVRGLWFCLFYMSLFAPLCPLCLACIWRLLCVFCMHVILTLFVIAHDATVYPCVTSCEWEFPDET